MAGRRKVYNRKITPLNLDIDLVEALEKHAGKSLSDLVNKLLRFAVEGHPEYLSTAAKVTEYEKEIKKLRAEIAELRRENEKLKKKAMPARLTKAERRQWEKDQYAKMILEHVQDGMRFSEVLSAAGITDTEEQLRIFKELYIIRPDGSCMSTHERLRGWVLERDGLKGYIYYIFRDLNTGRLGRIWEEVPA